MTLVSRTRLLICGAAALAVVLLLAAAEAPTPVRALVCLPLLVGISGAALAGAFLGEQPWLDPVVRVGTALLLGLAALLVATGLVAVVERPPSAVAVTAVDAGLAVLALLAWAWRTRSDGPVPVPAAPRLALPVAVGAVLVVAAFVVGHALIPTGEGGPTLSFTGPAATAPGPMAVAPGQRVALGWALRSAADVPRGLPVQAVLDGRPVDVLSDFTPTGDDQYAGQAQLIAPTVVGVHRVVLSLPLPQQRLELVTYLDVRG